LRARRTAGHHQRKSKKGEHISPHNLVWRERGKRGTRRAQGVALTRGAGAGRNILSKTVQKEGEKHGRKGYTKKFYRECEKEPKRERRNGSLRN